MDVCMASHSEANGQSGTVLVLVEDYTEGLGTPGHNLSFHFLSFFFFFFGFSDLCNSVIFRW